MSVLPVAGSYIVWLESRLSRLSFRALLSLLYITVQ